MLERRVCHGGNVDDSSSYADERRPRSTLWREVEVRDTRDRLLSF